MHNEETFVISRSVNIKIDEKGDIVVTNSVSRSPCLLNKSEFDILQSFAQPRSLSTAYKIIQERLSLEPNIARGSVEKLIKNNIITPAKNTHGRNKNYSAASTAFASPTTHHWMLRDAMRVNAYRTAIFKHVKDKVVVDIGCGSGILSIFACQAGAKKVFAIEESEIAILAERMFEANQVANRVSLLVGNSMDIKLPEPVDIIIHEILGVDPFFENIIPYIADARSRFFKSNNGILLPHKIDVYCVGLEAEFIPSIAARAQLEAQEFAGMYQVNFDPYVQLLSTIDEIDERATISRRGSDFREAVFQQPILSDECLLRSVDLKGDLEQEVSVVTTSKMHIQTSGRLGSILLYFRAFLDNELQLTTSPYAPRTHWGWAIRDLSKIVEVKSGEEVSLTSQIVEINGRQRLKVNLN